MEKEIIETAQVELVQRKIFAIRDMRVMLDSDLAELYQVSTKNLNKAVKRNLGRFPTDFMLQLTLAEMENLRFQIGTSSSVQEHGGKRYLPYAFTEQGVAMLSAVLRSERAVEVSILIMRVFSRLRELIQDNQSLKEKIDELEERYDGQFKEVFDAIDNLSNDAEGGGPMGFRLKP